MQLLKCFSGESLSNLVFLKVKASPVPISGILGVILFMSSLSFQAMAHHSAACCDFTQSVPIEGVIKSINMVNPHVKLILIVTDENGASKEIAFIGHSRNNVYRRGWRPDMVKAGEKVTINIAPVKSGADGGFIHSFTFSDGRQF